MKLCFEAIALHHLSASSGTLLHTALIPAACGHRRSFFVDTTTSHHINIRTGWHACLHLLRSFDFRIRYHSLVYYCASRPHNGRRQGGGKIWERQGDGWFWIHVQDGKWEPVTLSCQAPGALRNFSGQGNGRGREEGLIYNEIRLTTCSLWCFLRLLMSAAVTCSGVLFYFLGS